MHVIVSDQKLFEKHFLTKYGLINVIRESLLQKNSMGLTSITLNIKILTHQCVE